MRIAIIGAYLLPHSDHGAALLSRSIAKNLNNLGHDITIITGEEINIVVNYNLNSIEYICIPLLKNRTLIKNELRSIPINENHKEYANSIFNEIQYDVILLSNFIYLTPFIDVISYHKIPMVAFLHDYSLICAQNNLLEREHTPCSGPQSEAKCLNCIKAKYSIKFKILSKVVEKLPFQIEKLNQTYNFQLYFKQWQKDNSNHIKHITFFIAQSIIAKNILIEYGVPEKKLLVINQAIEANWENYRKSERKALGSNNNKIKLVYVGRMLPIKGVEILINILSDKKFANSFALTIVTQSNINNPYVQSLKFPVNLEYKFLNNLNEDEILKEISNNDILVSPSICFETGPRTVLEALSVKVPVICSTAQGNSYLIEDYKNGRLFNHQSPNISLKSIFDDLLKNPEIIKSWSNNINYVPDKNVFYAKIESVLKKASSQ